MTDTASTVPVPDAQTPVLDAPTIDTAPADVREGLSFDVQSVINRDDPAPVIVPSSPEPAADVTDPTSGA